MEEKIISAINIKDPVLGDNIRTLGWIHKVSILRESVGISLTLPTLLHPFLSHLKNDIQKRAEEALKTDAIKDNNLIKRKVNVDISVLPISDVRNNDNGKKNGCTKVKHIVAVYSCKGGVGKSTIAVNLAYSLAKMGGRIGLLDCDIYGPSLPTLIHPDDCTVRKSSLGKNFVHPIFCKGVKLLSLGFVSNKSGVPGSGSNSSASVMRGPMATKIISQLINCTDWGELDVLLLDLPPGTGDIPLSILQDISLSGVISITTPSKLSIVDAQKGIEMFNAMGVPTLALIQNMAYLDHKGERIYPFGKGLQEHTALNIPKERIISMPLSMTLNDANESGTPLCVMTQPDDSAHLELNLYENIASNVSKELFLLQHGYDTISKEEKHISIHGRLFDVSSLYLSANNEKKKFKIRLFTKEHEYLTGAAALEVDINGYDLRVLDPKTGNLDSHVLNDGHSPRTSTVQSFQKVNQIEISHIKKNNDDYAKQWKLFPVTLEKKGKYGYAVHWNDGATIIYSMKSLAQVASHKAVH